MMSAPVSVQEQHKMTAHASIYVKIVSCKGSALEEKQKQFIAKITFSHGRKRDVTCGIEPETRFGLPINTRVDPAGSTYICT